MKKSVYLSLFLVALAVVLTAMPAQATYGCHGVTSLKVWKTICRVCYDPCTRMVTVKGYIHVQNDPFKTAYISGITDMVEAKYKDGPWTELETVNVDIGDGKIGPGMKESYYFRISFHKGCWTTYRNVATVWLENHPDGLHAFIYRLSFNIP
jgi:hypothetical protein